MKLILKDKKEETSEISSFIFQPDRAINWKAGQFLQYFLPNQLVDDRGSKRYFTIASAPYEQIIMLTTRFSLDNGSSFKRDLKKLQIGQAIEASGPYGSFTLEQAEKNYIFIAGGIGITPFRSILLDLNFKYQPLNITLLYANRNKEIVYQDLLQDLTSSHKKFKIFYFVKPQVINISTLQSLENNLSLTIFYISGPKPFVESMEKILNKLNIDEEQVKTDYFPGYK